MWSVLICCRSQRNEVVLRTGDGWWCQGGLGRWRTSRSGTPRRRRSTEERQDEILLEEYCRTPRKQGNDRVMQ
jgi:hypothetical protein